jgi:hypothetical protein
MLVGPIKKMSALNVPTLQSQNFRARVNDCTVSTYWTPKNVVRVGQVNDDYLVLLVDFLSHADEAVGFKGQCLRRSVERSRATRVDCAPGRIWKLAEPPG